MSIIELIGPPGSGKSFFLNSLSLKIKRKKVFLVFLNIRFYFFFLITMYININQTFSLNCINFKQKISLFYEKLLLSISYYLNYISYSKIYDKKGNSYVDDGLIQYFLILIENPNSLKKLLKLYLRVINYKIQEIYIFKSKDVSTLINNMNIRKRWPRKRYGRKYFNFYLKNQIQTYLFFIDYLENSYVEDLKLKIIPIKKYKNL